MTERIAIIGANSCIGRNLTIFLEQKKIKPLLYDYTPAHKDNHECYHQIDLLDKSSLEQVDFSSDIFYFFTGLTGTSQGFSNPSLYVDVNEKMLLSFLTAYIEHRAHGRIIFLSTRLVYKGSPQPLREDAPKQLNSIYAVNKLAGEQYLSLYGRMYGVSYTVLRLCIPYGDRTGAPSYGTIGFFESCAIDGRDIPLYGDGSLRRTFTHMDDICEILLLSARASACEHGVFNIGGQTLSLLQAAQYVASRYGVGIKLAEWPPEALKIETGDTVFDSHSLDSIIHYTYREMISQKGDDL